LCRSWYKILNLIIIIVHNKIKEKKAQLDPDVLYYAGEDVPNYWNCYPWDAYSYGHTVEEHERIAELCCNHNSKSKGNSLLTIGAGIVYLIAGRIQKH
jgi:hypothetical protein